MQANRGTLRVLAPHVMKHLERLPSSINLRADLRRAVFAAAETCWVYAALAVVSAMIGMTRLLSPFGIWLTYWAALEIGHYLPRVHLAASRRDVSSREATENGILRPREQRSWHALQLLNLALAIGIFLLVLRLDLYRDLPLADLSWLPNLPSQLLSFSTRLKPEHLALLTLCYAYIRGVGFGPRPLTLWFIGFQFRLGVLIFFLIAVVDAWTRPVDLLLPIVAFFVISLVSISLARMQESGRERGLDVRWAVLLLAASLAVIIVGLSITPLLTLAGANLVFQLISPFLPVLVLLVTLIITPLAWLVGVVLDLLAPLLRGLFDTFRHLLPEGILPAISPLQALPQFLAQFGYILPYLRLLALIAVLFGLGLWVARALNRRMMQDENETYLRETAELQDGNAPAPVRHKPTIHHDAHEIQAENIRRIYAALLARAAALGLPRREAETPFEYLPRLLARFPEGAADLKEITDAYVAVHYGEEVVSVARVREVRGIWERLGRQMQKI